MRRAAKVDGNHETTVHHLRSVGWGVFSTAALGRDFPDLVVARDGWTALLEIKCGTTINDRRLTYGQALFHAYWPGVVIKADSPEDAASQLALEYEFAVGHPL
jgi:hypothetical protein